MMLLGKFMKQVMRAQGPFVDELAARDANLALQIASEARRKGMDSRGFVAETLCRFMGAEDSESWTTIIGNIQRSDDPGYAFIETIMRKRLSHPCAHWDFARADSRGGFWPRPAGRRGCSQIGKRLASARR